MGGRVGEGERQLGGGRGGDLDDRARKLAAEARSVGMERREQVRVRFLSTLVQAQALSCLRLPIPIPILFRSLFFIRDCLPFWLKYPWHPSPLPPFLSPHSSCPHSHVSRRTPTTTRCRPPWFKGPQGRLPYIVAPSTRSGPGRRCVHGPLRK